MFYLSDSSQGEFGRPAKDSEFLIHWPFNLDSHAMGRPLQVTAKTVATSVSNVYEATERTCPESIV